MKDHAARLGVDAQDARAGLKHIFAWSIRSTARNLMTAHLEANANDEHDERNHQKRTKYDDGRPCQAIA